METKIVSLITDFGLRDPYAAEMKAVILRICPKAVVVDITHEVESFNIRMGAFVLASAAPYFQEGSIHVAVIDPSVGSQRRAVIIQTQKSFFVGPDNGLLVVAAESQGIKRIHEITSRRLMLPHVSNTFHGRDVFAPAAAHIANGTLLEEFGPEVTSLEKPTFTKVYHDGSNVIGEILHIDGFGNIVTNIRAKDVEHLQGSMMHAKLPRMKTELKFAKTYAEVALQQPLALIGSQGYLEVAFKQGSAAEEFLAKPGDRIRFSPA